MKNIYIPALAALLISACEKEINIDLNTSNPQIVIEAELTDQAGPHTVKISKTVNFSDPNVFPAVQGALVTLSDNTGNTETLAEIAAGIYQTKTSRGVAGRSYTLRVASEGKIYEAFCTMPNPIFFESLTVNTIQSPFGNDTETRYSIIPKYTDPSGFGNCYRFIQYVNGKKDNALLIQNDNINDGLVNNRPFFSRDIDIKARDTLTVEMQCIDKSVYDFFYSLNSSSGNGPGGGTTPANPVSNFQGGALGYFSAHTSQRITVIVE